MTFFLSTILDNLTTSTMMVIILRKLIQDKHDQMICALLVIIATSSGGAFSPIGDVATTTLRNVGMIIVGSVLGEIFILSLVSMLIPAFLPQVFLKDSIQHDDMSSNMLGNREVLESSGFQRKIVLVIGVSGLCSILPFRFFTGLPPFTGILLVLGIS